MISRSQEIKPCPECGGKGRLDKFYIMLNTDVVRSKWAVICEECSFVSALKGTKHSAINSWNQFQK